MVHRKTTSPRKENFCRIGSLHLFLHTSNSLFCKQSKFRAEWIFLSNSNLKKTKSNTLLHFWAVLLSSFNAKTLRQKSSPVWQKQSCLLFCSLWWLVSSPVSPTGDVEAVCTAAGCSLHSLIWAGDVCEKLGTWSPQSETVQLGFTVSCRLRIKVENNNWFHCIFSSFSFVNFFRIKSDFCNKNLADLGGQWSSLNLLSVFAWIAFRKMWTEVKWSPARHLLATRRSIPDPPGFPL